MSDERKQPRQDRPINEQKAPEPNPPTAERIIERQKAPEAQPPKAQRPSSAEDNKD